MSIVNKGTGAGGAQTNKNGLDYEKITCLDDKIRILRKYKLGKGKNHYVNEVLVKKRRFRKCQKGGLKKYMDEHRVTAKCARESQPDECFIDPDRNIIFILEKKFQGVDGSVDDKIQTGVFKRWFYQQQYPKYEIRYAYVLNDWFKSPKYTPEMEYNAMHDICIFWGSDDNYSDKIFSWLCD